MNNYIAIGVYSNHIDVQSTIKKLQGMSIPMSRISIVGQALEAYVEHFTAHEQGAGSLETWVGDLPGIGPLFVFGPVARMFGGVMFADASGNIGGVVTFANIAADYREWLLEEGHCLVVVHCTAAEEPAVLKVLDTDQALNLKSYEFAGADPLGSTG
ncbi:MAG: hypothetical protein ABJA67_16070 [Chthonomonadales bacterium]